MRKLNLRTFFGILPPLLPYSEVSSPVETLPMPERTKLLFSTLKLSDVGVREGDQVKTGQNMGRAGKGPFISTTTGQIEEVGVFKGHDGRDYVAVVIRSSQEDSFVHSPKRIDDFIQTDPIELRKAINLAGFTILKSISSDPYDWPPVETLVVSTLDTDPLSLVNQQAFRDQANHVQSAVDLLARATEASQSVLAIPKNMANQAGNDYTGSAKLVRVPAVYPNGLPAMLAKMCGAGLLMKRTPAGVVGNTIVIGAEQANAMVDCLRTGKPLMEKTVTFSSGKNAGLRNFRVRIGAPVSQILQRTEARLQPKGKLIINGLLPGYACYSDEQPITETTDSIHVHAPSEVFYFQNTACINCGRCNAICPVNLEANLLGRFSEYGLFEECRELGAENCIACGLCAYVCPARRPLVQLISHAKQALHLSDEEDVQSEQALICDTCEPEYSAIKIFESRSEGQSVPGE